MTIRHIVTQARQVVSQAQPILAREQLSLEEWLVLDVLAERNGLAMSEIATATLASNATLTRHVESLVSRALVYRETGPTDRRQFVIYLSKRGKSLHERIASRLAQLVVSRESLAGRGESGVVT